MEVLDAVENALTDWLEIEFDEVEPRDFYRGIFAAGELEKKGEYIQGKYTGIIVAITKDWKADGRRKVYRYTLTDDLDAVETAIDSDNFCLCSPLSYAGKSRTAENARMLYAIAVDVDKVRIERGRAVGLESLWERHIIEKKRIPKPTYIVSSGTGLHLYYVLEHPLPLFYNLAYELQEYKRELTAHSQLLTKQVPSFLLTLTEKLAGRSPPQRGLGVQQRASRVTVLSSGSF